MARTLAEILQQSEGGSVSDILRSLGEALDQQNSNSIASFAPHIEKIMSKIDDLSARFDVLEAKPDPVFPEQKEFPKEIAVKKPDWYKEPIEQDTSWIPNLTNSTRYDGDKTRALLQQVLDKLNEEPKSVEEKPEPKTVNSAAIRSRRTTQWKRFDNFDQKNLLAGNDGGFTYFMPDSLIPNSETVKLNGAVSMLNSDYTMSGNKILFVNNQTGSQIEVRGQVK